MHALRSGHVKVTLGASTFVNFGTSADTESAVARYTNLIFGVSRFGL